MHRTQTKQTQNKENQQTLYPPKTHTHNNNNNKNKNNNPITHTHRTKKNQKTKNNSIQTQLDQLIHELTIRVQSYPFITHENIKK